MEVARCREGLPDQLRADDLAILLDQAAMRLRGNSACASPVIASG
jgi:hypothetical protein